MGCNQSNQNNKTRTNQNNKKNNNNKNNKQTKQPPVPTILIKNENNQDKTKYTMSLTETEIQSRIECPSESQVIVIDDITYKYAWVSQRGFYPKKPKQENQDSFSILPDVSKIPNGAFFAVYDGHGDKGHLCSRYIRDKLPGAINFFVGSDIAKPTHTNDTLCAALNDAHRSVNQLLLDSSSIDVTLSGTTSISILFYGRKMCISNVGDSRAIIVTEQEGGKLKALPLSSDQTPYRKDERERVKSQGARVLSMAQFEGLEPIHENWNDLNLGEEIDEGGDPPRVWCKAGPYPGVAFTRSFGDLFAKTVGVHAEPEILLRDVQPNDRYVIIASDGVFEFLTNQMVADMISQRSDPLEACRAIVAQSYELWLQYEVRTDDITIIALYIGNNEHLIASSDNLVAADGKHSHPAEAIHLLDEITNKPVRRDASREKKKIAIQALDNTGIIVSRFESRKQLALYKVPKTEEEQNQMLLAMSDNILFHHLTDSQRLSLTEMIQRVPVNRGDIIIKQGDVGDRFYIIGSGIYEVHLKSNNDESDLGPVVHIYESGPNQHPCFGELALMYGKPRAASIIALTDGMLWAIDRFVFVNSLMRTQALRKEILRSLRRVKAFHSLSIVQLQRLVDLMSEGTYMDGEVIVKQGDEGKQFYIVVEGTCRVTKYEDDQEIEIGEIKENDYFGEIALLSSEPHAVTVTAHTYVEVLKIEKSGFEEVLGDLKGLIEANSQEKKQIENINAPKEFKDVEINCFISTDIFGSLALGTFNSSEPNVCIKSFLLDAKEFQSVKHDIMISTEAARTLNTYLLTLESKDSLNSSYYFPKLLRSFCELNSFHMIFDVPIVASLESWSLYLTSTPSGIIQLIESLPFVTHCIIHSLEYIHNASIIYRSVQPEGIHINLSGHVVLLDYGISKVGIAGCGKTYTLCGIPDYLTPEQITQQGHNESVDFWELGLLLYELVSRENPFSNDNSNELKIMSKITNFGQSSIPTQFTFPSNFPEQLSNLISLLVVPNPDNRLGMKTIGGIEKLKEHSFLSNMNFDNLLSNSPLKEYSIMMKEDGILEGSLNDITSKWNNESLRTRTSTWLEELLRETM